MSTAVLRVRADALYAPTESGVVWLTRRGMVPMRGETLARWLDWILPRLDGTATLADLTACLESASHRRTARHLVRLLTDIGVVEETVPGDPTAPALGVPRVTLIGEPDLVESACRMARDATIAAHLDVAPLGNENETEPIVAGTALILHLGGLEGAGRFESMLVDAAAPVLHAVILPEGGCVGFLPPQRGRPWSALLQRLRRGPAGTLAARPALRDLLISEALAVVERTTAAPAAAVADDRLSALWVDGTSLRVSKHPVLEYPVHAVPPACPGPRTGDDATRGDRRRDDFLRAAVRCVDRRFGLISDLVEGTHVQAPLHVTEAHLVDPHGAQPSTSRPAALARVLGFGDDFAAAREDAVRRALAWYAGRFRLPGRAGGTDDTLTARPVFGGAELRVEAERVLDSTPVQAGVIVELPVGLGWGDTWRAATTMGLLDQVRSTVITGLTGPGDRQWHAIDLCQIRLSPTIRSYLEHLRVAGCRVEAFDFTDRIGVPVFGIALDRQLVAVESGLGAATAIGATVRSSLLWYQSAGADRYRGALPSLRSDPRPAERMTVPDLAASPRRLAGSLRSAGRTMVAVPLNHDPAVGRLLPHVVRVLPR